MRVECLGAGHPDTTMSLQQLAHCLKDQGKLEECERKLREALEARERALGEGTSWSAKHGCVYLLC